MESKVVPELNRRPLTGALGAGSQMMPAGRTQLQLPCSYNASTCNSSQTKRSDSAFLQPWFAPIITFASGDWKSNRFAFDVNNMADF